MGYLFVCILTGLPDTVGYFTCDNWEILHCEVFAFPDGPNLGMTSPLQKGFFSGSSLMGVGVWPRKCEDRYFEAGSWGLVDGDVGVGGCFRWPDDSLGLNMVVLSFPRE